MTTPMRVASKIFLATFSLMMMVVAFFPASSLKYLSREINGFDLIGTEGTVWNGKTRFLVRDEIPGSFQWNFDGLEKWWPRFNWTLNGSGFELRGVNVFLLKHTQLSIQGEASSDSIQQLLSRFDIFLSGVFKLAPLTLDIKYKTRSIEDINLDGPYEIDWSGGQISYILAQQFFQVELPPLNAQGTFENGKAATVISRVDNKKRLLELSLRENGISNIRVFRRLLEVTNTPWIGDQELDDVVIEIERKIF